MKISNFKNILLLLFLCVGCAYAANQQRSGSLSYHNYISYANWSKDSSTAYVVVSSDTLFLLDDSAGTDAFSTAAIGRNKSAIPGVYDRIPDSLGFIIQAWGGIDAVTYEFNVQYSIGTNSGKWYTFGTPDTFTVADTLRVLNVPLARKFIPDAKVRATIKPTTATDTVRIEDVRFIPIFR